MKPAVRYQGNHITGFLLDEPTKAAKTVLAIIIAPMMGSPAIAYQLIPVYSLIQDLCLGQSTKCYHYYSPKWSLYLPPDD